MKFNLFLFFLMQINICFSQVNIESMRNEKKDDFSGFLVGSLNFQKSNVDILEINASARIDYHIRKHREKILFLGKYGIGQQDGKDFKNEIFTHLRLNAYPISKKEPFSGEVFYQIQKDDFELLQIRQLFGCGARFESDKNKKFRLAFSFGMMADHEKIKSLNHNVVIRSTNYFILMHKTDKFNTFAVVYLQPRIVKPSDFRVLSEIVNEIKINKILSFNFTFTYRYDSDTPEGVIKNEIKTTGSLKYDF